MASPATLTPLSRQWVSDSVEVVWGFRLQWFQLEDLYKLLSGGIYSLMYPTDYGKSTLIEMCVVLGLVIDPNQRYVVVKINEQAARECGEEIARKLEYASNHLHNRSIKPLVTWRNEAPFGVGGGFWVQGAEHTGRNPNRSVHCYALGSRDLQGKRGRTLIDDIETQEEANSLAMRLQLEKRLSAVMRTLEDKPDALWAILGTPYHETSIHFDLVTKLRGLGIRYEEIRREPRLPDGSPLWAERVGKMEIHRRVMSKTEFAAAYELRPLSMRRFRLEEIDSLKDRTQPIPKNEDDFRRWLFNHLIEQKSERRDIAEWQREVAQRLVGLEFYVGWDPATTGDWASCVLATLGRQTYALRSHLGVADVWEQSLRIKHYWELFPSSSVIVEKNAQQKAFRDVFEKACPQAPIYGHGTYSNKEAPGIGMTAFAAEIREGHLHLPWGDQERSEEEFTDLLMELEQYGPTAHPHIIAAMWFCWYFAHKHEIEKPMRKVLADGTSAEITRHEVLRPTPSVLTLRPKPLTQRSHDAWKRHYR
jgi:hypothetical protein